ncbi:CLUMA_CG008219, isoform A [Clunio marinus]|uniref:CLUMA_CG008219, isoform A n=1 Tax=Clunio marinus TaxID=568069 RepID=A0A1J1I2Z3_9DIPT|nr:CLUMA_CG008219, isoform A [Clunio marinus]
MTKRHRHQQHQQLRLYPEHKIISLINSSDVTRCWEERTITRRRRRSRTMVTLISLFHDSSCFLKHRTASNAETTTKWV